MLAPTDLATSFAVQKTQVSHDGTENAGAFLAQHGGLFLVEQGLDLVAEPGRYSAHLPQFVGSGGQHAWVAGDLLYGIQIAVLAFEPHEDQDHKWQ